MEVVRILSIEHYEPTKRVFKSLAFRNSSGNGGISVVGTQCIGETSRNICSHLRVFYGQVASEPPLFLEFETGDLEADVYLQQKNSNTGDHCHYNLHGLGNKQARNLSKKLPAEDVRICVNGTPAEVSVELLCELARRVQSK